MIKALFFDIDGTLVSFNTHAIPPTTIEAIAAAKAKGIRIFIATGRPAVIINNLSALQDRGLIDGYITMNGGYCFVGEEVIYKSAIPAADVQTLARISSEQNFPCIFVGEHDICVCQPDDMVKKIFNDYLKVDVLPVKTPEEAIRREIFQMTPFITLEQEKEILPQLPDCESRALVSCLCRYHRQRKYQTKGYRRNHQSLRYSPGRNNGIWRRRKRCKYAAPCRHRSSNGKCCGRSEGTCQLHYNFG